MHAIADVVIQIGCEYRRSMSKRCSVRGNGSRNTPRSRIQLKATIFLERALPIMCLATRGSNVLKEQGCVTALWR